MADLVGKQLDKYEVEGLLGEGGMGSVYQAYDTGLSRRVALKVMHPHLAKKRQFQRRFMQEAKVAAGLGDHPSIVTIYEFDSRDDLLYMVMEFIHGGTLGDHIERAGRQSQLIELGETLHLLAQVADALDYAHRKGVVHRDIKPSNILLKRLEKPDREGEVPIRAVVTDFGLAKLLEGGVHTATGAFMGTYAYMSPEQCLGKELDGRSDIYSLGIVLYRLATGRPPFDIKTPQEAMLKHANEVPPPPRAVWKGLPVAIDALTQKAIAKQPGQRYQSAGQLADDLRKAAGALTEEDITRYAPEGSVMSLKTVLQGDEPVSQPSRMGRDLPLPPSGDQIVVARRGQTPRAHALDEPQTTIGRGEDNTIVLDDTKASRNHARVEFDGTDYTVTDLNSTNGTHLGDVKLLPGVPEVWTPNRYVRIGDSWLRLMRAEKPARASIVRSDGTVVEPDQLQSSPGAGRVVAFMEPGDLPVEPGSSATTSITTLNRGRVVDHFQISVSGVPAKWVTISSPLVRLMPDAQQEVTLAFQPTRSPGSRAGRYPVTIRVASQDAPDEVAELKATLTVGAYTQFTSEMRPQRIRAGGLAQVVVENQGNVPHSFAVTWEDRADDLAFEPPQARLKVPEGKSGAVAFRAIPRRRRWIGGTATHVVTTQINSADGATQTVSGEVISKALMPAWVLQLMVLPCLALVIAAGFLYNDRQSRQQQATQTMEATRAIGTQVADAAQTATFEAASAIALAETATAAQLAGANQATIEAATATAIWLDQDDDRDGLTNRRELELNTLSGVRDTDEDGLADGVEVDQWNTDPLDDDSDDDGLKDGDEVGQGIDPLNADTDDDGTPDASDPDPGTAPTPTPNGTATAQAVATQTAVAQAAADATATAQAAAGATATAQAAADATATAQAATAAAQAAAATAEAAATATAQAETLASFVGDWVNVDANTGGMTRLIIEKVDDATVAFHGYGSCVPSDCDWDAMVGDAERMPSKVPVTGPKLVGTYEFGFVTKRISVERSGDQLVAEVLDDYPESDSRTDRTNTYVFRRQLILVPMFTLRPPLLVLPTP